MPSRVLTVTLEPNFYQGSTPTRRITYNNNAVDLSDTEYSEIASKIPPYWNSENDLLIRFIYFDDNTYFCERRKKYFNYTTREADEKIYKFDYATKEEADALYAIFVESFARLKISKIENLYDTVMDEIGNLSVIKISLLDAREKLLQQTDYLMMSDYPLLDEERQKWVNYRQQLRDLTEQEAWINNDLINIKIPVSPQPVNQLSVLKDTIKDLSSIPSELTQEIIDTVSEKPTEEIIENIMETSIKFELLKSISKINIPILNVDYDDLTSNGINYETFMKEVAYDTFKDPVLPKDWWEAATSNIEKKISQVNSMLKSYNVEFTINDILNSIIEENKFTEEQVEVNTIIEEL